MFEVSGNVNDTTHETIAKAEKMIEGSHLASRPAKKQLLFSVGRIVTCVIFSVTTYLQLYKAGQ